MKKNRSHDKFALYLPVGVSQSNQSYFSGWIWIRCQMATGGSIRSLVLRHFGSLLIVIFNIRHGFQSKTSTERAAPSEWVRTGRSCYVDPTQLGVFSNLNATSLTTRSHIETLMEDLPRYQLRTLNPRNISSDTLNVRGPKTS